MAGIATAQNTSLFGGSALTVQHCSILQGADSLALVSQLSGRSGHAHDTSSSP